VPLGQRVLTAALVVALARLLWPSRRADVSSGPARGGDPARGPTSAAEAAQDMSRGHGGGHTSAWVARVTVRAGRRSRRRSDDPWVADFAEVVAVGLDAGLDLPAAALASARSPGVRSRAPWLSAHLQGSVDDGRAVTTVLEGGCAVGSGIGPEARRDLALLVAAWRLAEEVGAAASAVTTSAATSVRERRAAVDRTAVVVAGPRASMVLLSALPLAGPAAALVVGLPPGRLYDSVGARVLGLVGLLLTAVGWWWARGLLRRARRPGRTDGDPA
jgi:tight adherence protein B